MTDIKQSSTYARKFLMVLTSDHVSGATGKTVTVSLSKGPSAGGTAPTGGATSATELDSSNLPGVYQIVLSATDTSLTGDLWYHCTASGCDPNDFCDQVKTTVFTDLLLDSSGRVYITAPIKQNQAVAAFPFLMTTGNPPVPGIGLTVSCQRSLGGAGFAPCQTPTATQIAGGWYYVPLAAGDTNAPFVAFRATASGANDQDILIPTQP